jgi:hypothetical protein
VTCECLSAEDRGPPEDGNLDDLTAAEPLFLAGIILLLPQGAAMKLTGIAFATATIVIVLGLANTFACAQGGAPSGRGSTTGDPAASSATPGTSPTTGSSTKPNPSGSGTSTSGGNDANADQGRDKMPESGQRQRPNDAQKQR